MWGQIKNFCSGIVLPVDRCRITFWYIFLTFDRDIVFRDKLIRQKLIRQPGAKNILASNMNASLESGVEHPSRDRNIYIFEIVIGV